MAAGGCPRVDVGDALLPRHLLRGRTLRDPGVTESDRRDYDGATVGATGALVLSRAARSAQGRSLAPSPLLPDGARVETVDRMHVPPHAYSGADRILARPDEAAGMEAVASAGACSRSRRLAVLGGHDGVVRPDHPAILRALAARQSASSLVHLLRDPQGFVWRYALGWRSGVEERSPLSLDDRTFGELVHDLLHRVVALVEPAPGLAAATAGELESALVRSSEGIAADWPATRQVPPATLWRHAVEAAVVQARRALALDAALLPGTRSWSELGFGSPDAPASGRPLPWDASATVLLQGTEVRLIGSIDRLDLLAGDHAVRLSDYKTGQVPSGVQGAMLAGGAELQRAVYAMAVLSNLPDVHHVVSRLVYLAEDPPVVVRLDGVQDAVATLSNLVTRADALLRRGIALPGPDASGTNNAYRLALPAASEGYFAIKGGALSRGFGDFADVWRSA